MSTSKESVDGLDPDYAAPATIDPTRQELHEKNARANAARTITDIVEREFSREIDSKEKEVLLIQDRLHKALKTLHLLRYVVITDFYNRKQCLPSNGVESSEQTRIHPAVKKLLGKAPRQFDFMCLENNFGGPLESFPSTEKVNSEVPSTNGSRKRHYQLVDLEEKPVEDVKENGPQPKKIPRYIPPKCTLPEPSCPSRGIHHKIRRRVVVGNVSKWIPPDWREDGVSHKWMVYVRGDKENPGIGDFVSKVRFFLHPSYRPNDIIEVASPPFHLTRRGWGEFPIRVQLHFKNTSNKPMDVIHHLKLDRTYTGLQTLGAETVVDVWIYPIDPISSTSTTSSSMGSNLNDKSNSTYETESSIQDVPVNNLEPDCLSVKEEPVSSAESVEIKDFIATESEIEDLKKTEQSILHILLDHNYSIPFDSTNGENDFQHGSAFQSDLSPAEEIPSDRLNKQSRSEACSEKTQSHENSQSILINQQKQSHSSQINNDSSNCTLVRLIPLGTSKQSSEAVSEVHKLNCSIEKSYVPKLTSSLLKNPSQFQPLEISIPPAFAPTGCKKIQVVFKNGKLIPSVGSSKCDSIMNQTLRSNFSTSIIKPSGIAKSVLAVPSASAASKFVEIKPSSSLLLTNSGTPAGANWVPALQIANSVETQEYYDLQNPSNSSDCTRVNKPVKPKVTIGKDKYKILSKKDLYDKDIRLIEEVRLEDTISVLKFIIRRIPLITENASDPEYRRMHVYACASEGDFFSYNIGRQRAMEWYRAKTVRSFLKKKVSEENLWSIKEILIWARLHGFTPTRSSISSGQPDHETAKKLPSTIVSTCTDSKFFDEWLEENGENSRRPSNDEDAIEVDVVSVVEEKPKRRGLKGADLLDFSPLPNPEDTIVLELPEKLQPMHSFVCETASEIGVALPPETIIPGVIYPAAGHAMLRAVQCFMDDLLRLSLAKAHERTTGNQYPETILLDDVRGALFGREEFDLFTSAGLGSRQRKDFGG
ncbi:YEATS domain-containing protein 2 [Orussus abietinus]|uniref:YEATS domain-containing protein 2 n=1 Tax=Orussus abietinus TaxID=222816 RepID=UPI000626DF57|nr:YEATS domain-containing protein 2 [Orussus abietinus]